MSITQCNLPWTDLIILSNGKCVNCYFQNQNECIGNVNEDFIENIWNGDLAKSNRKKMLQGIVPDICNTGMNKCPYLKE
jgi:radical SAM protein with 4Fe4S-binding SPASM domain